MKRQSPLATDISGRSLAQRIVRRLLGQRPVAAPPEPGDPRAFQPVEEGSGAFGRWILDDAGLPAYLYEIDQYRDPRARYANTENLDRRDHWHQIGNDRVTALASNDGTVQLYLGDRGGVFLNRFEAMDDEAPGESGGMPRSLRGWLLNFIKDVWWALSRAYRRLRAIGYRSFDSPFGSPFGSAQGRAQDKAQDRFRARRIDRVRRGAVMPRGTSPVEPTHAAAQAAFARATTPHAYAGGFGYLDDGAEAWATAFRYRPTGAETRRVFGMGYHQTAMTHRDIRLTRHVYAPYGDDPTLLIDVRIDNLRGTVADIRCYEYWDVNVHQLKLQWLRSHPFAAAGDDERHELNKNFTPSIEWDARWQALRFHQQPSSPDARPPHEVSDVDWAPPDVFLADLTGSPPAARYTDKAAFFGRGGAAQPDAVRACHDDEIGPPAPGHPMPYCLVLRRDLHLEPGASAKLRYAYGALPPGHTLEFLDKYRTDDPLAQTLQRWKEQLAYFTTGQDWVLQRETAWHAHNLLSATVYNAYCRTHLVPQGSAYLYLHGADGAPRDQALFALPLVYLRPELARETLQLIMSLTHADTGAIPYAFAGHGFHSDGLGIHAAPSDLDLFFLLALSEYLAATGDVAFLETEVPFYPRGARPAPPLGMTVLDHVRVAVTHLVEDVGIGEHGLIKIGDGDWSDGIVCETAMRDGPLGITFHTSKAHGESVPNTQMALYVLPLTAAIVEASDPALAARMRELLPGLRTAVRAQWNGRWYTRAILRDFANNPVVVGDDWIDLAAQPWAMISGFAADMGIQAKLIESITRLLDDPSPVGAPLHERGLVWPAVSQLLTWGYTRRRQDLAWRSLKRHTFAAYAKAFPHMWINTWSGPDAIYGPDAENPGGTWVSPVTPMTDFPVMNANQHAMALLGLLRVCGVEPAPQGDGLIIAPKTPPERFSLNLPLLRLDAAPGRIAGEYHAVVDGSRMLYIRVPEETSEIVTHVDGRQQDTISRGQLGIALKLIFKTGQAVPFEVLWN